MVTELATVWVSEAGTVGGVSCVDGVGLVEEVDGTVLTTVPSRLPRVHLVVVGCGTAVS